MAPLKLGALYLSLGYVALPEVSGAKATPQSMNKTTDVVEAINLVRTGKINDPMDKLVEIGSYPDATERNDFLTTPNECGLRTDRREKGFFAEVTGATDATSLQLKDYLTVFDRQLASLDELIQVVNSAGPDGPEDYAKEGVSNLAFLVSSEATKAGCGVMTGCESKVYLFCTFTKPAGRERTDPDVTGAPKVKKEFLDRMKERRDAGISLASLESKDMGTPLPTTPENSGTGSSASKFAVSSVVMVAAALFFCLL